MTTENYGTSQGQPTPDPSQSMIGPRTSTSGASLSNAELRRKDRPDAIERVEKGFERKNKVEAHRLRAAKVLQAERDTTGHDLSTAEDRTSDSGSQIILDSTTKAPKGFPKWVRRMVLAALVAFPSIGGISYACETLDKDNEVQAKNTVPEGQRDESNRSPEPQEKATEEGDAEDTENDEGDLILLQEDIRVINSAEAVANELEGTMTEISKLLDDPHHENEEDWLNTILGKLTILSTHLSDLGIVCQDTPEKPLRDEKDCRVTMSNEDFDAFKNYTATMIAFKKLLWNDPNIQKMRQDIKGKKKDKKKKGLMGTLLRKQKNVFSKAKLTNKNTKMELIEIERILRLQLTIILNHLNH